MQKPPAQSLLLAQAPQRAAPLEPVVLPDPLLPPVAADDVELVVVALDAAAVVERIVELKPEDAPVVVEEAVPAVLPPEDAPLAPPLVPLHATAKLPKQSSCPNDQRLTLRMKPPLGEGIEG